MITKSKSRQSCANICKAFVCEYYKDGQWYQNPHGTQNGVVYIGTEMELLEEVSPILLAYIADVPEEHITEGRYKAGEEERVDYAIDVLDRSRIYLEYVPQYNVTELEKVIEFHVVEHKVDHFFFDYIHITAELLQEYQQTIQIKMNVREDQALANLSLKIKDLTRKYNISIDTFTQVSGDFKNENNYDQTIVRGAKSIVDKVDLAYIVSRPTDKEYKLLDKILRSPAHLGLPKPNICYSVYKNRGGKYTRIKIWLYIDYSTMRVHDQFCTDYEYNIIQIPPTFIAIDEDQKVIIANDKKTLTRNLNEATYIMNQIEDDGIEVNDFDDLISSNNDDNEDILSDEDIENKIASMSPEEIVELDYKDNKLSNENINENNSKIASKDKDEEIPTQDLEAEIYGEEPKKSYRVKLPKNSKYKPEDFDW